MDSYLNKRQSKFNAFMDAIYFLVVVNLLALIGTIIGLGLFGFFPALMTTYTLVKMRLRNESFGLLESFVKIYKREFVRANQVGLIVFLFGGLISLSWFFYLQELTNTLHWIGLVVMGLFGLLFFVVLMILPITYVYFPKFSIRNLFQFSVILALGMPLLSFVIVLNVLFFYFIVLIRFISIFPFLAFTLPAYVNMMIANRKIMKLFTVFRDETISMRTLNSFSFYDQLYYAFTEEGLTHPLLTEAEFTQKIIDGSIEGRLSLVMLDQEERVKGMMLTSYVPGTIAIEFLWIDSQYRHRGYAQKMLTFIKKPLENQEIESIQVLSPKGYWQTPPPLLLGLLPYFKKNGFDITMNDQSVQIVLRGGAE